MRKLLAALVVVAVLAIGFNDAGRYAVRQKELNDVTYELAAWAADHTDRLSRDQAAAELARMGAARGITVYQYGQTEQNIQIWTQAEVTGTIIAGTVINLTKGLPFAQARNAPIVIRDYQEAGVK